MNTNHSNETELTEILQIARNGEIKLREMSDHATIMAEKWRTKTGIPDESLPKEQVKLTSP
jgi:hypothetical protein